MPMRIPLSVYAYAAVFGASSELIATSVEFHVFRNFST
jgi:hypothetical protein